MSSQINYDFTVAGDLSAALAQLRSTLEDLVSTRKNLKTTDLDQQGQWKGKHYDDFVTDYQAEQNTLGTLIETLNTIQIKVQQATVDAVRAQRMYELQQRTGT